MSGDVPQLRPRGAQPIRLAETGELVGFVMFPDDARQDGPLAEVVPLRPTRRAAEGT